jgi:hypothetical protein
MMGHGQNGVILLVILLKKEECNIEKKLFYYIKKVIGLNLKIKFFSLYYHLSRSTAILYSKYY